MVAVQPITLACFAVIIVSALASPERGIHALTSSVLESDRIVAEDGHRGLHAAALLMEDDQIVAEDGDFGGTEEPIAEAPIEEVATEAQTKEHSGGVVLHNAVKWRTAGDLASVTCRCPGFFQEQCEAEAAQGCVWSTGTREHGPWCQCGRATDAPTDAQTDAPTEASTGAPTDSPATEAPASKATTGSGVEEPIFGSGSGSGSGFATYEPTSQPTSRDDGSDHTTAGTTTTLAEKIATQASAEEPATEASMEKSASEASMEEPATEPPTEAPSTNLFSRFLHWIF